MRVVRYMTWAAVLALTVWSVGCGGAAAPTDADTDINDAEIQQQIDAGQMMDPNSPAMGQGRFRGDLPEGQVAGDSEAGSDAGGAGSNTDPQ